MTQPETSTTELNRGDTITLDITRMAHGGRGIGLHEGRVIMADNAFPGDTVEVELTKVKKRFAEATTRTLITAGPLRNTEGTACAAYEHKAGCCDLSALSEDGELTIKETVLRDQLERLGGLSNLPPIHIKALQPTTGWRTRARLGVDEQGRAGLRKAASNTVIPEITCQQLPEALTKGVLDEHPKYRFTPGAEVILALDSDNQRHIVEVKKAARGRRMECVQRVIEGSGTAHQEVLGFDFEVPAAAFWQAHVEAPAAYSQIITELLQKYRSDEGTDLADSRRKDTLVGWDLYGGVGVFAPAIARGLGEDHTQIQVVERSHAATRRHQACLDALDVHFLDEAVESGIARLSAPTAVVLDPPRTGAGEKVVKAIAQAHPAHVIHIGCDPATLARDLKVWTSEECGYQLKELHLFNAFPGTHHFETVAYLAPTGS